MLALLEREVSQLEEIKAQMVDAEAETRHDIIRRLLTSVIVETHGSGRQKTGMVRFSWWYAVESVVEAVGLNKSSRSSSISTIKPYIRTAGVSTVDG